MNAYWPTLGKYVEGLEKAGKLLRITIPVNKDTELHPLVRLQFRGLPESQRKAFLFENVVDGSGRRYDIPVLVGALAGSADIYALGMGCDLAQIEEVWRNALAHQIAPVVVDNPACQEVVITGAELKEAGHGLGRLPIPISTPGFDNAPYTTAGHWVTKDPETGMHNLGNYRGMVKAEDRIGVLLGRLAWGMRWHIDRWRERGATRVPAAIVVGVPPHVSYAAVTRIPNDMCEYDVAGGFVGRPLELTRCVTQDLLVPARVGDRDRRHGAGRYGGDGGRVRGVPRLHGAARLQLLHGRDRHHHPQEADLSLHHQPDAAERKQQDAQYRPRRRRHPAVAQRRHG